MIEDLLSLVDDASSFPYSGLPASTPDSDHNDDDDSCQDDHHHYHEDDALEPVSRHKNWQFWV